MLRRVLLEWDGLTPSARARIFVLTGISVAWHGLVLLFSLVGAVGLVVAGGVLTACSLPKPCASVLAIKVAVALTVLVGVPLLRLGSDRGRFLVEKLHARVLLAVPRPRRCTHAPSSTNALTIHAALDVTPFVRAPRRASFWLVAGIPALLLLYASVCVLTFSCKSMQSEPRTMLRAIATAQSAHHERTGRYGPLATLTSEGDLDHRALFSRHYTVHLRLTPTGFRALAIDRARGDAWSIDETNVSTNIMNMCR